jgi:microcystin-dependent protein
VNENPGITFGIGVWEAFGIGRTLVGVDVAQVEFDSVQKTGGAKTHTLLTTEMPAHTHDKVSSNTAATSGTSWTRGSGTQATLATNSAGGGLPHNNLQPYITVYMWRRIS